MTVGTLMLVEKDRFFSHVIKIINFQFFLYVNKGLRGGINAHIVGGK